MLFSPKGEEEDGGLRANFDFLLLARLFSSYNKHYLK